MLLLRPFTLMLTFMFEIFVDNSNIDVSKDTNLQEIT